MSGDIKEIKIKTAKILPDLDARPYDKGFYHLMLDAQQDEEFTLVGKNVFRKDKTIPFIDEIVIDNRLVAKLLQIQ